VIWIWYLIVALSFSPSLSIYIYLYILGADDIGSDKCKNDRSQGTWHRTQRYPFDKRADDLDKFLTSEVH
jgi:hypothetical protein